MVRPTTQRQFVVRGRAAAANTDKSERVKPTQLLILSLHHKPQTLCLLTPPGGRTKDALLHTSLTSVLHTTPFLSRRTENVEMNETVKPGTCVAVLPSVCTLSFFPLSFAGGGNVLEMWTVQYSQ